MAKTKKQWQKLCKDNKVKYTEDDTVNFLVKSLASSLGIKFSEKDSVYKLDGKITEELAKEPEPKETAPDPVPDPVPEPIVEPIVEPTPEPTGDPLENALAEFMASSPTNIINEKQLMFMGVSTYSINMPNVKLKVGKYMITRDRDRWNHYQIHLA